MFRSRSFIKMIYCLGGLVLAGTLSGFGASRANATVHLWQIQEVYSNADASVQFIELFTAFNSQQFSIGVEFKTQADGIDFNSFIFPTNTPSPTANHHLLLATPGFAALPGAVTPDFTLPTGPFFDPSASTITTLQIVSLFADIFTFAGTSLPTDGVLSLNRDFTSGTNSPTNFAGEVGALASPPPLDGDLNADGFVGVDDLNIVLVNWNTSPPNGDLGLGDPSGDGFVGVDDLNVVLVNWNNGTPPTGDAAIPEPASLALLGVGAGVLLTRLR